jgi:hypothetical protein
MIETGYQSAQQLEYDEALLYCYTCTDRQKYDWRMPTSKEHNHFPATTWHIDRIPDMVLWMELYVIPVRDKDV